MTIEQEVQALGYGELIGHYPNGSPEWLKAREGVGGSDIGTICGVNKYKTYEELVREKTTPDYPPLIPSLPMRLGTEFESGIRKIWAEDNAKFLTVEDTGTWRSVYNPWFKANPDGLIKWANGEIGISEIKYSQVSALPDSWLYQVNWYLMILGLEKGIIVQCSGNKFIEHYVTYNAGLAEVQAQEANKYLEEIKGRVTKWLLT